MGKFTEKGSDGDDLELSSSSPIGETAANTTQHDAVFGEMSDDGPNYRDVRTHCATKSPLPAASDVC